MNFTTIELAATLATIAALSIPILSTIKAYQTRIHAGGILLRWRSPSMKFMIFAWWVIGAFTAVTLYKHGTGPVMKIIFIVAFISGFLNILVNQVIIGDRGIYVRRQLVRWESIMSFSFWSQGKVDFMKICWHLPNGIISHETTLPIPSNRKNLIIILFRKFIPSVQSEGGNGAHEN